MERPRERPWARRPRRRVRRIAKLAGKLPGDIEQPGEANPQTPFVIAPGTIRFGRRPRTTIVVDLTDEHLKRLDSTPVAPEPVADEADG